MIDRSFEVYVRYPPGDTMYGVRPDGREFNFPAGTALVLASDHEAEIARLTRDRDEAVDLLREYRVNDRTEGISGLARQQRCDDLFTALNPEVDHE